MSNERYLIVSYFVFAAVCLGLGILVHQILQRPFATIVDAIAGKSRSALLKRALRVTLTCAGVLGFLGYSYNERGCVSYQQVIQNRESLISANVRQVQGAADWIIFAALAWGVLVVVLLSVLRKQKSGG